MRITGLILKDNVVPKERLKELHVGSTIYVKGNTMAKIVSIRHHTKKSTFAKKHSMATGVYCVNFIDSDKYYVIAESNVVFTIYT